MPAFAALVGSKLSDIEISVPLQKFVEIVWVTGEFLSNFLTDKLLEKDVAITEWKTVRSSGADRVKFERAISSQHPLPISLPWLPLFIESSNIQSLEYDHVRRILRIVEISTIKGLPFVDPFIITEWDVHELPTGNCRAHITLRFEYEKASWLQSMVESNSRTELVRFFEMWEINFASQLTALKERNEIGKKPILHSLSRLFLEKDPCTEEPNGAPLEPSPVIVTSDLPYDTSNDTYGNAKEGRMNTDAPTISKLPAYIQQNEKIILPSDKISSNFNDEGVFDSSGDGSQKWASSPPMGDFTDRNILFETIAALIINYFYSIKVAALHGIEVNNSFRWLLDQTASISLIFYCILIFKMVVKASPSIITTLLSSDLTDYIEFLEDYSTMKVNAAARFLLFRSSFLSLLPPRQVVEYASVGTQTEFDYKPLKQLVSPQRSVDLYEVTESSILDVSSADSMSGTWRDCQTPVSLTRDLASLE